MKAEAEARERAAKAFLTACSCGRAPGIGELCGTYEGCLRYEIFLKCYDNESV